MNPLSSETALSWDLQHWVKILADVPSNRFDERPAEGRFTLREAVAHLADFEPIFRGRMEAAYESPGVTVEPKDEGQMAIDHNYASQDLYANLENFAESEPKPPRSSDRSRSRTLIKSWFTLAWVRFRLRTWRTS